VPVLEARALAGDVLDLARGQAAEAGLDGFERISRAEQLRNLRFGQVERHRPEATASG